MNVKLKDLKLLLSALGAVFITGSCVNEDPWGSNDRTDGKIQLNLKTDGSIIEKTRAEEKSPFVPKESEFEISLKSNDGSYSNSWTSLDAFNKEKGFPMGSYVITASYGEKSQEGFENPYFSGSSSVNVSVGSTTDAEITATLANSMISIIWDDAISSYYPNHSAIAQTEGKDPVVFVQNEERPGYLTSGNVTLKVTLTDDSKNTITVSPTTFVAEPRKHYKVTFGIEGGGDRGYGQLTVDWSEETVNETKEILLSEEMFAAPVPTVSLQGSNPEVSLMEGLEYNDLNPEFHIFSYIGLAKATLSIIATEGGQLPACGSVVKLLGEGATDQSIVKSSGIDCSGIYDRKGDMAVVNIKELVKSLIPGVYSFTFEIEDELGRTPENSVTFKVVVTKLDYKIIYVKEPEFLDKELTVVLGTNSEDVKDQFTFKSLTASDEMAAVESELLSNFDFSTTSSEYQHKYAYKLTVPEIDNYKWKVSASISGKGEDVKEVDVKMPNFTLELDAFAKRVKIRPLESTDEDIKKLILERGKIYDGDQVVCADLNNISADGIMTFTNLEPNKTYNYTLNLGRNIYSGYLNNATFTTELDADVPNGDFEETDPTREINISSINVGGQYKITPLDYQRVSSISRQVAKEWATLNDYTCYINSENKNTWFMVPSTFLENGINIIRTVGYHHNGTTPKTSGGAFNTKYYCENAPTELNKRAGELFLGNYSFDGQENRTNFISFTSRPNFLKYSYSYSSLNGENGVLIIRILDKDKKVIIKSEEKLGAQSEMLNCSLALPSYSDFGEKACYLELIFKSSDSEDPAITIPSGNSLYEPGTVLNKIDANTYKAVAIGSELKISNVHFVYE